MKIGYDQYAIMSDDLLTFLRYVKNKRLKVKHIQKQDFQYTFYIPVSQRYLLKDLDISITYLDTIGFMKYILYFRGLNSLCIIAGFIIGLILFTHIIFNIKIIGTLPNLNKDIMTYLKENKIENYTKLKTYEQLNDILVNTKNKYKEKIEYLNVYQKGSVFFVEYTKKRAEETTKDDYQNIYASKDGMIESFDVESGNIKVKRLDYVKKGDLLVENCLTSTDNETVIIPVKGHVYAYTFNTLSCSVKNKNQDQGEVFYELLLKIRSKLPANVTIDKEKVLQIERTRSKITLKMHYTLLEDIAVKKENK